VPVQIKNGQTPLHLASLFGRLDIARVLLGHGATTNLPDRFGRTPLHLVTEGACNSEQDRIRIVQLLLENGADINAQDEDNATPLHLASHDGRVEIARTLLEGAAAANSKDGQGRTPLHSVAEGRYLYSEGDGIRVVRLLLERGAEVDAQDEDNISPLHLASYHGRVEIVRALLDGSATTSLKGNQGWTPLHVVAEGGDYNSRDDNDAIVAQLLLERGADVNVPDDDNQTPLHLACYFGRVKVVQVLINAGANVDMKNDQGQSPLHVVSGGAYDSQEDGISVARLLVKHGADVNAQDNNHATPSYFASHYGRPMLLLYYADEASANIDQALMLPSFPPSPRSLGLEGLYLHDKLEDCPSST
jgi:ankyrin repeat protein